MKVIGNDPDNGINGTINYSFRTNSTWLFEINKSTGEIYSKQLFDYESEFKQFLIIIDLEDNGISIRNQNLNACQIEIFLEDINDNPPELIGQNQTKIFIDINKPLEHEIIRLNVTDKDSGMNGKIKYNLQSIDSSINFNHYNQTLFDLNQNGSLQIHYEIKQIALFKLQILLEDYGYPSQQTLIEIILAFGNQSNSKYSSLDKIQIYFNEKQIQTNYFAFIFALIILIISLLLLIFMIISCLFIRKHRQRHKTAIISRNKLLCSSSQQLTISNSTVTSNTNSTTHWNERAFGDTSLLNQFQ
jgi:hypothetical protein